MGTKINSNYSDLLTFTRASKGHALRPVSYGTELVTNGDFSDGLNNWTDNSQGSDTSEISVVSGQLNVTCVGSDTAWAYQIVNLKVGALYQISYDVIQTQGGNIHVYVGASAGGGDSYQKLASVGSHTDSFVADDATSYLNIREFTAGTSIIDNLSIKEVTFDQTDGTLTLFEHPNNVPRVEWDADRNRLGLLVEEQRINQFIESEDFSSSKWVSANNTETANAVGPNKVTNSAYTLSDDNSGGTGAVYVNETVTGLTTGNDYTASVFAKAGSANWLGMKAQSLGVTGNQAYFDLSNGVLGNVNAGLTATMEDYGDGWYRCSITFEATSDTSGAIRIQLASDDQNLTVDLDGTNNILIFGAQFEEGSFPTSYIKSNSGSTTTRSADVASIPVADFGYNQSEGTLFVEYIPKVVTSDIRAAFDLTEEAGSTDNRVYHSASTGTHWLVRSGASLQASIDAGTTTANQTNKVAGVYKVNDFAVTIDGGTVATDTNGNVPVSIGKLFIGKLYNGYEINGHIKKLMYIPRRVTNAQLISLTE